MNYIKAWQSLPDFGISLFIVKFMGHKKEELLGVAFNRLMRMDINTGDHIKTWTFNTMKVNDTMIIGDEALKLLKFKGPGVSKSLTLGNSEGI